MLLQIQVYPLGSSADRPPDDDKKKNNNNTYYASLSSTTPCKEKTAAAGRLWSVGRKLGDAVVRTDKSLSKEHMQITLVSANKTHFTSSSSTKTKSQLQEPGPCETPVQIEACKRAEDQMCVLIHSIGRFGSYIVEEDVRTPSTEKKKKADKADDDDASSGTDDSDTADEQDAIIQESQQAAAATADNNVALSTISQELFRGKRTKIRYVPPNESAVLDGLSLIDEENDDDDGSSNKPKQVIVQCGKLGTTVVLTRMEWKLVPSSTETKRVLGKMDKQLLYMNGCEVVDDIPIDEGTATVTGSNNSIHQKVFLVTSQYNACTKQISAWSLNLPFVHPNFLEALADRQAPSDPLPDPAEFPPEPDDRDFWTKTKPNPKLWKSCTLFKIHKQGHELETLVRAGGVASVVDLTTEATDAESKNTDEETMIVQAIQKHPFGFCINDARRKLCKTLKRHGIPCLTGKEMGKAITEQRLLQDANGNPIGTTVDAEEEEVASAKQKADKSSSSPPQAPPKAKANEEDRKRGTISIKEAPTDEHAKGSSADGRKPDTDTNVAVAAKDDAVTDNDAMETTTTGHDPPSTRSKRSRDRSSSECAGAADQPDEPRPSNKKKRKSHSTTRQEQDPAKDSSKKGAKRQESSSKEDGLPASSDNKRKEVSKEIERRPDKGLQPRDGNSARKEMDDSKAMKKIGGWMSALPQGNKRREYLRTKEEIKDVTGLEEVRSAAVTERVRGLTNAQISKKNTSNRNNVVAATIGKNFKAFRKNPVPSPPKNKIALRVVMAKEMQKQRELDEQRSAIEAQQRRAEALFRDGPIGGARSRRRR